MRPSSKLWLIGIVACLGSQVLAALLWHQSFRLTALSDIVQSLLPLSGALAFLLPLAQSRGRQRLFWALMSLGMALWFCYQMFWTYFEVLLRQDVPDLFAGDIVLFLHIVPFMAALALRPHVARDEYAARLGRLDFALLTVWWIYLYVLIMLPWQYAVPDQEAYGRNLNAVYLAEKLVFLGALSACWISSKNHWKTFYANFFGASLLYAASSYLANWALVRQAYYSGSLYDIPLAASMAWVTFIALSTRVKEPQSLSTAASTAYGVWVARCGMIAAFSLPLFATWALVDHAVPPRVRSFRLVLTLVAALLMGVMVFVRQRFLDNELMRLLNYSRDSFDNLKRLQDQIIHSEKLASIGQLVGGAAHELNNPLTAMLGYSDLLLSTSLSDEQHAVAAIIGQHVRRTRSLVASLLSFAKPASASKTPVDLNTLVRTSVKLTQPQWQASHVQLQMDLEGALPKVLGDSNQLLQLCLQVIDNGLRNSMERGGTLSVSTRARAGLVIFEISENAAQSIASLGSQPTSAPEGGEGLALSACMGIVQAHNGRIACQHREDGSTTIRVELPGEPLLAQAASHSATPLPA